MKTLRRIHGIYPMLGLFNLFTIPIHMVYISMINRLAYNVEINPGILTDGILWFKDLSSPDPTGILPIIGGAVSYLNIITSAGRGTQSKMLRNISKFMKIMPLVSIPIWMTFPAAFNIYWIIFSLF